MDFFYFYLFIFITLAALNGPTPHTAWESAGVREKAGRRQVACLGDQAQTQGPGRVRRGRRMKPSVAHPQRGTSEQPLWGLEGDGGEEALPIGSHPPWPRATVESSLLHTSRFVSESRG